MDRGKNANQKGGAGTGGNPGSSRQKEGGTESPKDEFFGRLLERQAGHGQGANEKGRAEDNRDSLGANANSSHLSIHGPANSVYRSPQKPQISFLFAGVQPEGESNSSQLKAASHGNTGLQAGEKGETDDPLFVKIADFLMIPEIFALTKNACTRDYLNQRRLISLIAPSNFGIGPHAELQNMPEEDGAEPEEPKQAEPEQPPPEPKKKVKIYSKKAAKKKELEMNSISPAGHLQAIKRQNTEEDLEQKQNSSRKFKLSPRPSAGARKATKSLKNLKAAQLVYGPELRAHIYEYLEICLFLAVSKKLSEHVSAFAKEFDNRRKTIQPEFIGMDKFEPDNMLEDQVFVESLLKNILKLDEAFVYRLLLAESGDLHKLVLGNMAHYYLINSRMHYLDSFFQAYRQQLKKQGITGEQRAALGAKFRRKILARQSTLRPEADFRDTVLVLLKAYFQAHEDNHLLMHFFKYYKVDRRTVVELLLDTKEEERIIKIVRENPELLEHLRTEDLFEGGLYQLFVLYDPMTLILKFNTPVSREEKAPSLYQLICDKIQRGENVEALCNVVIQVSETFWDIPKMYRFYRALEKIFNDRRSDWLIYVQNPLLFCMTLVYFFMKLKRQLDYNDNKISNTTKGLLQFCRVFVENASEETLNINLFDKDGTGLGFLDYAFMVADMDILETEQIEGLIQKMWDLGRHTMQTVEEFMRLNSFRKKMKRFTFAAFKEDFSTVVEEDDHFQWEFNLCSQSVFLKVASEIFWPIAYSVCEFVLSIQIINLRLRDEFDSNWLFDYYAENAGFVTLLAVLRVSYVLSAIIKNMAIRSFIDDPQYVQVFFNIAIGITFLQVVIYPLLFWDQFWFINISQMLYVLAIVTYVVFNALSLNFVGVILRIFARMSLVVVIFGTLSCVVILVVAYPIHIAYVNFSEPVTGFAWNDNNLFNDLYQGVLTLFEFTFGAVVLVRPYREASLYSYSTSFIMVLFSFFGNIMLANLLVAFLTSQFDHIQSNAKYLTMNMQFGLIKVFKANDLDAVVAMPFILTPLALPCYLFMMRPGTQRKRVNKLLQWAIHIVNVCLPVFLLKIAELLLVFPFRYLQVAVSLLLGVFQHVSNLFYFFAWLLVGPFFLAKLFALDVASILSIVFSNPGQQTLLNFELEEEARSNLVEIFQKFNRVIQSELALDSHPKVTVRHFKDKLKFKEVQDAIVTKVSVFGTALASFAHSGTATFLPDGGAATTEGQEERSKFDLNGRYSQDESKLIPELLLKYAKANPRYPSQPDDDKLLDLKFMSEKFANKVNMENVDKLIAYEQRTLDKARQYLQFKEEDAAHGFKKINSHINKVNLKVEAARDLAADMKDRLAKMLHAVAPEIPRVEILKQSQL